MTEKRFILKENGVIDDTQLNILLDGGEDKEDMVDLLNKLHEENEQLKAQLYCDDEGICNICKYHYLVSDDESEFGYYNSRCKKGHYECARISLKYCDDFEKGDVE